MVPLRLRRVAGLEGRLNDILFHPALVPPAAHSAPPDQHTLVFFGGDIQDYPEVMAAHRQYRHYRRWDLESSARLLADSFPGKHILVVRPSRIELKSFSCYDNFVPSNKAGVPEHTGTHNALAHLERLLMGVSARLRQMPRAELLKALSAAPRAPTANGRGSAPPSAAGSSSAPHAPVADPLWWRGAGLERARVTLVGFSKGCVVLNQLLYEFHSSCTLTPGELHAARLISRIESMYWLDGGHAGGKHTWLSARPLLETLARTGIAIYIHVSPYQVCDATRPWIGQEERAFTATLTALGAKVSRYLHTHAAAPVSLHTHFRVLADFKRVQDAAPAPTAPAPALTAPAPALTAPAPAPADT